MCVVVNVIAYLDNRLCRPSANVISVRRTTAFQVSTMFHVTLYDFSGLLQRLDTGYHDVQERYLRSADIRHLQFHEYHFTTFPSCTSVVEPRINAVSTYKLTSAVLRHNPVICHLHSTDTGVLRRVIVYSTSLMPDSGRTAFSTANCPPVLTGLYRYYHALHISELHLYSINATNYCRAPALGSHLP